VADVGSDAGGGVPLVRPIGLSPTLGLNNDWWPAVRWPPSDLVVPNTVSSPIKFPDLAWDASLFSLSILGDFVGQMNTSTNVPKWTEIALPTSGATCIGGTAGVDAELADLVKLIEYRPEVMAEALAQSVDMVGYWAGLLMFNRYSHPWTFRMARTAIVLGEFVVMNLKYRFKRPRPSQLSPALMPPIAVPGHASYPSGHATQAYLLSGLMEHIMPSVVVSPVGVNPLAAATVPATTAASLLTRLAERVARNREVLGVHYRSDSEAGKNLAGQILTILLACPLMSGSGGAVAKAKAEWS
jgi:hypothetical protein